MKITLLTPTRKRPAYMKRLWDSAIQTAHNPSNIEIVFYIDDYDSESISMYESMKSNQVKAVIGERIILSKMWNEAYKISSGEICTAAMILFLEVTIGIK